MVTAVDSHVGTSRRERRRELRRGDRQEQSVLRNEFVARIKVFEPNQTIRFNERKTALRSCLPVRSLAVQTVFDNSRRDNWYIWLVRSSQYTFVAIVYCGWNRCGEGPSQKKR